MRLLVFGDFHISSDRDVHIEKSVDWVCSIARLYGVNIVVFLGDLFDNPGKALLPVNMLAKHVLSSLAALSSYGIKVFCLVGNHDIYSSQYSMLQLFDSLNIYYVFKNTYTVLPEYSSDMVFLPYLIEYDRTPSGVDIGWLTGVRSEAKQKHSLVFCHIPFEGMKLGAYTDKGISFTNLVFFDVVFGGHYHTPNSFEHQALGGFSTTFYFPGTLCPKSFSDSGLLHGAILWDSEEGKASFVPNPHRYVYLVGSEPEVRAQLEYGLDVPEDHIFIRLTDSKAGDSFKNYKHVELRPKKNAVSRVEKPFSLSSDPVNDLRHWLASNNYDEENMREILARGIPILEGQAI